MAPAPLFLRMSPRSSAVVVIHPRRLLLATSAPRRPPCRCWPLPGLLSPTPAPRPGRLSVLIWSLSPRRRWGRSLRARIWRGAGRCIRPCCHPVAGGWLNPSTQPAHQAGVRRRPDGLRRASFQRKAATSDSGSGSGGGATRRSSSSTARRKKAKVVAGLLELSLAVTPSPLTRGKLKLIAEQCDLNASGIFDQVQARAASSEAPASSATSSSSASSVRVLDCPYA